MNVFDMVVDCKPLESAYILTSILHISILITPMVKAFSYAYMMEGAIVTFLTYRLAESILIL